MQRLKFREYLVFIFIFLGLSAFIFESKFHPVYYTATGIGEGYMDDISVSIKAYKKKNGDLRIVDIAYKHSDTDAIVEPTFAALIENVYNLQDVTKLDTISGATYSTRGFIDAIRMAASSIIGNISQDEISASDSEVEEDDD